MSIQSIIQHACQTFLLENPQAYGLYLKKAQLQSSLSVRLANIPSGSKLTLVHRGIAAVSTTVTIGLQTEEAGRLIDQFSTETNLWSIIRHFEQKSNLNFTRKTMTPAKKSLFNGAKGEVYVMPVCVFMNREYSTIAQLKATTLGSLGINSSAGLRLLNRITPEPISAFIKDIEDADHEVEPVAKTESTAIETKYVNKNIPLQPVVQKPNQAETVSPVQSQSKTSTVEEQLHNIDVSDAVPVLIYLISPR